MPQGTTLECSTRKGCKAAWLVWLLERVGQAAGRDRRADYGAVWSGRISPRRARTSDRSPRAEFDLLYPLANLAVVVGPVGDFAISAHCEPVILDHGGHLLLRFRSDGV